MNTFLIRTIQADDNKALATIIRDTLAEFKANKPGTVYFDPTTDNLFQLFETPDSAYFIAESRGSLSLFNSYLG